MQGFSETLRPPVDSHDFYGAAKGETLADYVAECRVAEVVENGCTVIEISDNVLYWNFLRRQKPSQLDSLTMALVTRFVSLHWPFTNAVPLTPRRIGPVII